MIAAQPWQSPLTLARALADEHWALFYSSAQTHYSGRYSLLACNPVTEVKGAAISALRPMISSNEGRFDNAWFGYIGYGADGGLERVRSAPPSVIALPEIGMTRFATIYSFDHAEKTLARHGPAPKLRQPLPSINIPGIGIIESNFSKQSYLHGVSSIREAIYAGEVYQVNLTRKFFGRFSTAPDPLTLFERLCEASAAPYSAMLKLGNAAIISSSPECFLTLSAGGALTTRPIKGSAPRAANPGEDAASREMLCLSAKDRAENLMIVDLMRNDFSRVCVPGSVRAPTLYEVSSFSTIHHMASTITGRLKPGLSALDAVAACFPPGSMTGAPKLRAIDIAASLEGIARGVYSGALGWFAGDGGMDLSVVIRTLIVQGDRFEFQVGGGIVADSDPEAEWRETLTKAEGIRRALAQPEGWLEHI